MVLSFSYLACFSILSHVLFFGSKLVQEGLVNLEVISGVLLGHCNTAKQFLNSETPWESSMANQSQAANHAQIETAINTLDFQHGNPSLLWGLNVYDSVTIYGLG